MINIHPLKDLKSHVLDSTCHCRPTIREYKGETIIIHNSYYEETYGTPLDPHQVKQLAKSGISEG